MNPSPCAAQERKKTGTRIFFSLTFRTARKGGQGMRNIPLNKDEKLLVKGMRLYFKNAINYARDIYFVIFIPCTFSSVHSGGSKWSHNKGEAFFWKI